MSVTLLHISDLHFCCDELRNPITTTVSAVKDVTSAITGTTALDLDFSFADDDRARALLRVIGDIEPDVVCITGDLTTFGDKKSFADAAAYIKQLRDIKTTTPRAVVTVPGNHDTLRAQLPHTYEFLQSLPWCVRRWASKRLRPVLEGLKAIEAALDKDDQPGFLANYRQTAEELGTLGTFQRFYRDCNIAIVPFNTVSASLPWVNLGAISASALQDYHDRLAQVESNVHVIKIACCHHNPLSSPELIETPVVHAYNSMPGASTFMHSLQEHGIELLLHGHQHQPACYMIDFVTNEFGHLFVVGAPSLTTLPRAAVGSPTPVSGFDVITIDAERQIAVETYEYQAGGTFKRKAILGGILCERTTRDKRTLLTRGEIYKHRYHDEGERKLDFDWVYDEAGATLIVVGTALENFRDTRFPIIKKKLEDNTTVRILMADPTVCPAIYRDEFLQQAPATIGALVELLNWAEEQGVRRPDVRLSSTPIPFSAAILDPDQHDGRMVIELLPIGTWTQGAVLPRMRLLRQQNEGFFRYYAEMAAKMHQAARPLRGGER